MVKEPLNEKFHLLENVDSGYENSDAIVEFYKSVILDLKESCINNNVDKYKEISELFNYSSNPDVDVPRLIDDVHGSVSKLIRKRGVSKFKNLFLSDLKFLAIKRKK